MKPRTALAEAESRDRVLSVSCPLASGAFFAILAYRKINNLHVINTRKWFKSTPRNQTSCYTSTAWERSSSEPFLYLGKLRRTWAKNSPSCSATFL